MHLTLNNLKSNDLIKISFRKSNRPIQIMGEKSNMNKAKVILYDSKTTNRRLMTTVNDLLNNAVD